MSDQPAVDAVTPSRELQRKALTLRRFVEDAVTGDDLPADLHLVGIGPEAISAGFDRLERRTRASVWNMQRSVPFVPESPNYELDERSRRRGLEMRMLTAPIAKRLNPLLPCLEPGVRVGPVPLPMMVLDQEAVVLPGPNTPRGELVAWLVTDPGTVRTALELFTAAWAVSEPWVDTGKPPLTPRQFDVARLLAGGMKDEAIARQLRVSRRTVVAEVEVIAGFLGARSRFEAGAMIRGSYE